MEKVLRLIKQQRIRKGISQSVMGRRLNMVRSAYGKIEAGKTELSMKRLKQVCDILGLNVMELMQQFLNSSLNNKTVDQAEFNTLSIEDELDLSRRINSMYKVSVTSFVEEKYRMIMEEYPYTEFTSEEWWDSLGENKEQQLGMTEKEFWELFAGGFQMIFTPEDEYNGFKKLVSAHDIFYFFRLGLVVDEQLCGLFQKYLALEDLRSLPAKPKIPAKTVLRYLQALPDFDIYEVQDFKV